MRHPLLGRRANSPELWNLWSERYKSDAIIRGPGNKGRAMVQYRSQFAIRMASPAGRGPKLSPFVTTFGLLRHSEYVLEFFIVSFHIRCVNAICKLNKIL